MFYYYANFPNFKKLYALMGHNLETLQTFCNFIRHLEHHTSVFGSFRKPHMLNIFAGHFQMHAVQF